MSKITNTEYLRGILENDYTVLKQIYDNFLPDVIRHVKRNSGTLEDAKDVFQEAIIVIFRRAKNNNLAFTSSFSAFLFGVSKMIWLKKLKKSTRKQVSFEEIGELIDESDLDELLLQNRKWLLFKEKLEMLPEESRQLMEMSFKKVSGREIAAKLGYTEDYVKRKRYKCKQQLAELIKKDPAYWELMRQ